ncbi:MAG: peptide chain release factor 1 [bacterium]|nr:peptide chain release factor 1 [bacterium]MDO5462349.1 peptide chain release factor 1 [bacterium]
MIDRQALAGRLAALDRLEAQLSDPAVTGNRTRYREVLREHTALRKIAAAAEAYFKCTDDIATAQELLADPEMGEMAQEELATATAALPEVEERLMRALLPVDPLDDHNAMVEIRAGTGGDEAALFAGDLFRMYSRWCEMHGYSISVMDASQNTLGGYKEVIFSISGGDQPYGRFRFESGGHRVQRVPVTEAQGRVHTSAATVVVLPEADEEDDLVIPESELRIDIFCAGGHGGQGVNTTYSAIRITHLPTGLVAQCQDERSQHRNKEKALAVLKSRILDARRQAEEAKAGATRLTLRGSGDRSQRIRTYNFPQNRLTDHRIGLTLYSLDRVMEGELDELFGAISEFDMKQRLEDGLASNG